MPRIDDWSRSPAARLLMIVAAFVVVVAGCKAAAGIIVPLLLALFLAVITTPLVVAMKARGLGTATVLLIMIFGIGMLGFGGVVVMTKSLQTLTTKLPAYQRAVDKEIRSVVSWLNEHGLSIEQPAAVGTEGPAPGTAVMHEPPPATDGAGDADQEPAPVAPDATGTDAIAADGDGSPSVDAAVSGVDRMGAMDRPGGSGPGGAGAVRVEEVMPWLSPGRVMGYVGNTLRTATGLLGQSFLIFIVLVFVWLEAAILPAKIERLVEPHTWQGLTQAVADVRTYVGLKTIMSLATGLAAGSWCWIMGVEFALLWGVAAFFLNFVPTIGSIVAALPPLMLALVTDGIGGTAILAVGYVVINVGISNGIEPRFMGRGLGLSPLVVVLSMIIWGWVLGPIGMLLSVPLTTLVKLGLSANDDTRWMAVILGSEVPAERVSLGSRSSTQHDADL